MAIVVQGVTALVQVFDMKRAVGFYRDVLGAVVVTTSDPQGDPTAEYEWAMLRLGEAAFMLNTAYEAAERPATEDPARVAGHADTVLYFNCDSADEAYEHLRAKGWPADPPVDKYYGMRQVYTKDADGYELCFQCPV